VPLAAHGRRQGILLAWRRAECAPFDDDDLQLLADVGRRAGIAIDNLRLLAAQTRIATRLQQTLLPAALPTIPGVELAARYLAAEHDATVGGDFYDVFGVGDAYALVIGDVAGRGVDAAGLTGIARVALRTLADHLPPPAMLARLNALLTERSGHTNFLTLAFLLLFPHSGGATVHTWLAGHPHPQLIHPDGALDELGVPGHLLGILTDVTHHHHACELVPGDLLLLYTDGLTEARGPRGEFGDNLFPAHLTRLAGATAADTVDELAQAVTDYRTIGVDDTAILAVRLSPPGMPAGVICPTIAADLRPEPPT
jgi:phosphoserine phosphatase RsbU/P